jgi:hypothetical protein
MGKSSKTRFTRQHRGGPAPWSVIAGRVKAFEIAKQEALSKLPASVVDCARDADPVGAFLSNAWVAWSRWQDMTRDAAQIALLLDVANGKASAADREVWRDRLHQVAAAQNDVERRHVARKLTPQLIRNIADSAVFVVDQASFSALRLKMLPSRNSQSTLSYGALLLLNPAGPGKSLCECKYTDCGTFFFRDQQSSKSAPAESSTGRRGRKNWYCVEHRKAAALERSNERVRSFRDRRREQKRKVRNSR